MVPDPIASPTDSSAPHVESARVRKPLTWLKPAVAVAGAVLILASVATQRIPNRHKGEFSVTRVRDDLQIIAASPRPIGSASHERVRRYLVDRLGEIGAATEVQSRVVIESWRGARVANVIGRLNGTARGNAVVLVAHYDTIPGSAGATDDGLGVAVVLEVMRVLSQRRPANDVFAVFTDGEEAGILGAQAARSYLAERAGHIAGMINLEARGNSGPVVLFQTNTPNASTIEWLEHADTTFRTSSVYSDLFQYSNLFQGTGYGTDMDALATPSVPSVNLAFIARPDVYHTDQDTVSALDWSSVPEFGAAILQLARRPLAPDPVEGTRRAYLDLFGQSVVSYPAAWCVPAAVTIAVAWLLSVVGLVERTRLSRRALLAGCGTSIATVMLPPIIAYALGPSLGLRWGMWVPWTAFSAGLAWATSSLVSRRANDPGAFWLGYVAPLLVITAAACLMPGSAYLVQSLCAMLLLVAVGTVLLRDPRLTAGMHLAAVGVFAVVIVPVLVWLWIGLGGIGAPLFAALSVLGAMALAPTWSWLVRDRQWSFRTALACMIVAAAVILGERALPHAAAELPIARMFVSESHTEESGWLTFPRIASQAFRAARPMGARFPALNNFAVFTKVTTPGLSTPRADVMDDRNEKGTRVLVLRLQSSRSAPIVHLWLDPDGINAASLEGQAIDVDKLHGLAQRGRWLRFIGVGEEGLTLIVHAKPDSPIRLRLADQSYDLPEGIHAPSVNALAGWNADSTVVTTHYRF
jgi:Peptidase family M28